MIFDGDGQTPDSGIERRSLGDGPGAQHLAGLDAQDLRRGLDRLRRRRQPPPRADPRPRSSGLIEFLAPEQRVKADPFTGQGAGASFLPVDDAQRMADLGPQLTQLASGDHDLPA